LKEIKSLRTRSNSDEVINKTYKFIDGKLSSIQTSDIIQSFFYNPNGYLNRSVKERIGSDWKELVTYKYDDNDRLIKLTNEYKENNSSLIKTVTFTYSGSRITAVTTKSNTHIKYTQYMEYVIEEGQIVRESERNLNQDYVNKKEIGYYKDNLSIRKGLFGDKSSDYYAYDDKNSIQLLLLENVFGANYKTIVPLVAPHEKEFLLEGISQHNLLKYSSNSPSKLEYTYTYTYNNLGYPKTSILLENNKIEKTTATYSYE
jgi:hypothetical protein